MSSAKLKTAKLLHGFRNSPPVDVKAVAAAAAALGRLMRARPEIIEVDVNPLMVHAAGQGATALDALIVTGGGEIIRESSFRAGCRAIAESCRTFSSSVAKEVHHVI